MRELSLHILDIAQNSISAGASHIIIVVKASTRDNLLTIRVSDTGKGMSPEFVARVRDPFVTTRTVRKVGLGIPMLSATAEMCGGGVKIESAVGKGTTIEATFELDNMDRPPIGEIVQTMITLIVANPDISFTYEHSVDEKTFILNTDEIKAQIEDVPITEPSVVRWIREYMTEQIAVVGIIN